MPDGGAASSRRLALHLTLRFAGLPKEFRHHRRRRSFVLWPFFGGGTERGLAKKGSRGGERPEIQNLIVGRTRQRNRYRQVADKVSQRIRDNYPDRLANGGNRPNHHFTLAFGPVPAPGWRRLSSPVFSPGTGSPLAVVELVDAQPLNPQMAAVRMANIKRYFIRLGT